MPKIFISYRRADSAMLSQLLETKLKAFDIESYVDTRSIDGGGPFPTRIYRAIEAADVFVCLLGPTTLESEWVRNEIRHAHKLGKILIPVFQERYVGSNLIPDDYVEALLQSDGVHFLDVRNIYVDAAILSLAEMILKTPQRTKGIIHEISGASDFGRAIESASVIKIPDLSAYNDAVLKILPPPFEWCFVPAGDVTLETGMRKSYAISDFIIAKYTVTNAQFQDFVDAHDGYLHENQYGWYSISPQAHNYRSKKHELMPTAYVGDDLPRTNICWFDAVAFCRWLSRRISQNIALPSEEQWQYAAQGDTNWIYPWGNDFELNRCNTREMGIGVPTPVTDFPNGASSFNVFNMSGNVYEFCANNVDYKGVIKPDTTLHSYALKGGSFYNNSDVAIVTSRITRPPHDTFLDFGFRLVLSI